MKRLAQLAGVAAAALALSTGAASIAAAGPDPHTRPGADHVVFVQTDNLAGNQIVAYDRADSGALTFAASYPTGGLGGALNGAVVDDLASQGSLAFDARHGLLYAVNAGSNTVSVFSVHGDRLALEQVVDSGGTFPVSVAVHDDLVYVLNARDGGSIAGFRAAGPRLHPIERSARALGLTIPSDGSEFTHTPGQVLFSPDGRWVLVTTKASANSVEAFAVAPDGRLAPAPVVTQLASTVPFAGAFDLAGHLLLTEAGPNAVASFRLGPDGGLTALGDVATAQAATCWIAGARGYFFASNAGSGSLSGITSDAAGNLGLVGTTATGAGTVDAASTSDGAFLYVQTGKDGLVDVFRVNTGGSLTSLGSVTVPGAAGGEGIVAS